ncbi:hypothetical protein [Emcibacter sp.]|uniref:hypothetical protein n=1 Tax=Emcibacter sp. TaxID=1979954 RepID=UPI002AA8DF47|nr:hypothetical protein [Emcibacter sp.]
MSDSTPLNIWSDPTPNEIGNSVKDFLNHLGGPVWIDVTGRDQSRCRVVTTLLHGNEPSGTKALYQFLKSRTVPAVNMHFLVCSVEAALTTPEFSNRHLPGKPDMNRCFRPPFDSQEGKIAERIIQRLQTLAPEAVVDIHNTSGSGPDFTVTSHLTDDHQNLAARLSSRLIYTGIKLGSLMEIELGIPVITLEAGGSWDLEADQTAMKAIQCLTEQDDLFAPVSGRKVALYAHPMRLEVLSGTTLDYGTEKSPDTDMTLHRDIEHQNFGVTAGNTALGWMNEQSIERLMVRDYDGKNLVREMFYIKDGELFTACDLRLFMVTTRPRIALSDCLFYLVKA